MNTIDSLKKIVRLGLVMLALVLSVLGAMLYVEQPSVTNANLTHSPAMTGPVNGDGGG